MERAQLSSTHQFDSPWNRPRVWMFGRRTSVSRGSGKKMLDLGERRARSDCLLLKESRYMESERIDEDEGHSRHFSSPPHPLLCIALYNPAAFYLPASHRQTQDITALHRCFRPPLLGLLWFFRLVRLIFVHPFAHSKTPSFFTASDLPFNSLLRNLCISSQRVTTTMPRFFLSPHFHTQFCSIFTFCDACLFSSGCLIA